MQNKIIVSILILFLSCSFAASICTATPSPLNSKIIVIDPGHGGNDNGAIANGVREANVNLAVGLKIRDKLLATGATVILTRSRDESLALKDRVDIANAADADIFVSIHANTFSNSETAGAISFYQSGRPNNLAAAIQEALIKESGATDKRVRPANFYVMRENYITAALIEIGFLTNAPEALRLTDNAYQEKVAEGISKGIISYLQSRV
ncbi:MAG: N-acetylmuramoyl-L-alanine amidase [Sporomusaceae bacterium]|nr:N-acetylmuramoyl-L-alanine amidase [Sporomusaceae bacterium]